MSDDLLLKPIGYFHCETQTEPYQVGRQPDNLGLEGCIRLLEKYNFEQALQDIDGCSHIWIIFGFHQNKNWKPLVQTPRSDRKIGVFATRAPYRPNPLGLSAVSLNKIEGLNLILGPCDLLDGSPIYDIKPYHPDVDSIPAASINWLETSVNKKYYVTFSPAAEETLDVISTVNSTEKNISGKHIAQQIRDFIHRQLEYDPTNTAKKRVQSQSGFYTLSYRTFRIDFTVIADAVGVLSIYSGYSPTELNSDDDPYNDKVIHHKITGT